jgi:hypothetical protein
MSWLAGLLGVDPDLLRFAAGLLSLIAAACTATSTVLGVLNRRRSLATAATAEATNAAVLELVELLSEHGVRRVAVEAATAAATEAVEAALAPVHQFYAALELVEHRRGPHNPETDIIRILQEERAA